ncbi:MULTISPECIES: hypothetical protein [Streptomyces]|uniref:hypothetical protein n=1 Tax=Streptomyces TaxID=1883 RepID=UPI00167B52AB|nr:MULTISPECIES: hypothetical protein [Streptomyces]MBD3576531.1 hypothetical protein [Streptomyces sp. KD18]GGT07071.1 hypothetical protein GCM10010286_35560 [Streptomyces toxytricini]
MRPRLGPPPPHVRALLSATEGTVHLAVGGPNGAPLKAVRAFYALTLDELRTARTTGLRATPFEAAFLRAAAVGNDEPPAP